MSSRVLTVLTKITSALSRVTCAAPSPISDFHSVGPLIYRMELVSVRNHKEECILSTVQYSHIAHLTRNVSRFVFGVSYSGTKNC